jgi:hypothetical protein
MANTTELYPLREYELGTCFGCQRCFVCGLMGDADLCGCDQSYGPRTGHRASATKGFKYTGYTYKRGFQVDGDNKNSSAAVWYRGKSQIFGYGLDFYERVEVYLCGSCNSELSRKITKENKDKAKEQKEKTLENQPDGRRGRRGRPPKHALIVQDAPVHEEQQVLLTPPLSCDDSLISEDQSKVPDSLRFKLAIRLRDGTQLPAQWITVKDVSFTALREAIKDEVVTAHGDDNMEVNDKDLIVAYKSSTANGLGTVIKIEDDFVSFCKEYVEWGNAKKTVLINVNFVHKQSSSTTKKKNKKQVCYFIFILLFTTQYNFQI